MKNINCEVNLKCAKTLYIVYTVIGGYCSRDKPNVKQNICFVTLCKNFWSFSVYFQR